MIYHVKDFVSLTVENLNLTLVFDEFVLNVFIFHKFLFLKLLPEIGVLRMVVIKENGYPLRLSRKPSSNTGGTTF